ncbi:MAG: serine hydrolase [bacterium]|nr:serine hydrolase [bacterium]
MPATADSLTPGAPADVGLSATALARAADLLTAAVDANRISAASLTVARHGRLVHRQAFGRQRPEAGARAVEADSIFLLASITKPVTACAMMLLVDRGLVSLDDPVQLHIPEFVGWDKAKIRVRDILSHISGMPDMLPQNTCLRQAHAPIGRFVDGAIHTRLLFRPHSAFRYQSKGILLAAEIVERTTGMRLRDFEQQEIFGPLGMGNSFLGLQGHAIEDLVWCTPSMQQSADAARWGGNSPYWRDFGCPWGGMHSTGPDLAILLQCLLNGGTYGNTPVFSRAAATAMVSNQNPAQLESPWGIGWALRDSRVWSFFGEQVSAPTFGHVGATGTVAWADPVSGVSCVCLTNQMDEGGALLRRVSNAVAAAVVD